MQKPENSAAAAKKKAQEESQPEELKKSSIRDYIPSIFGRKDTTKTEAAAATE